MFRLSLAIAFTLLFIPNGANAQQAPGCQADTHCQAASVKLREYATTSLPTCNASREGQIRYDSTLASLVYCNGSAWTTPGASTAGPTFQRTSVSWNIISLAPHSCTTTGNITAASSTWGAGVNDQCLVNAYPPNQGIMYFCHFNSGSQINFTQCNITAGTIDPPTTTFWFMGIIY